MTGSRRLPSDCIKEAAETERCDNGNLAESVPRGSRAPPNTSLNVKYLTQDLDISK